MTLAAHSLLLYAGALVILWVTPGPVLIAVTARALMRLIPSPPGDIARGRVVFDGEDVLQLEAQLRHAIVPVERLTGIVEDP